MADLEKFLKTSNGCSSFKRSPSLLVISEYDSNDDVFETASLRSQDIFLDGSKGEVKAVTNLFDSFMLIISGLYGIMLVVVGAIVPMAETFIHPERPYPFEVFYVYLYSLSIAFIIYIYMFLLHDSKEVVGQLKRHISERSTRKKFGPQTETESFISETGSVTSRISRRRKITFNSTTSHSAASFYLRLGAVAFGIGCMILEGLYLGQFLELTQTNDPCGDFVMMIRPLLKPCFTFSQLFFIFRNSKIVVYKARSIARFGFMHMAATNICVWFRTIVMETLQTFHETLEESHARKHGTTQKTGTNVISYNSSDGQVQNIETDSLRLPEFSCRYSNMIGGMLMNFSHFLYPFCIEYSVICAGVLYVMWKNIEAREKVTYGELEDKEEKQSHRMSVDCAGSSRGLFTGIALFVAMVCSMVVFYVIGDHDIEVKSTAVIIHSTEIIILSLAIAAIIGASIRMRDLRFTWKTKDQLEETLILVSLTGLYAFAVFSLIAAVFYSHTMKGILTIVVDILMILLATVQTIFLIVGLRLSARMLKHVSEKPGREFVTFLMLCNFSLWAITTFEMQKPMHNPQQMEFYGPQAWTIFTHISVPLGIFYFFHCTVCLSHIWKNAWKFKRINVNKN